MYNLDIGMSMGFFFTLCGLVTLSAARLREVKGQPLQG